MKTVPAPFNIMQNQIDHLRSGFCMLIRLMNYDELQVTCGAACYVMTDLNKIIQQLCYNFSLVAYSSIKQDEIFVILPRTKQEILTQFVWQLYSSSQLYTDTKYPEAYMNCKITDLEFPRVSNKVGEIYRLLANSLSDDKRQGYYNQYDCSLDNQEVIKSQNKNLNNLRKALSNRTVTFAYQPIIDRKTGHTHYHECLLRMPKEDSQELISVGSVIQDAENKGLINLIDQTVLRMAVDELASAPDICLSINISNMGILDSNLARLAEELLNKHKVADRLIIEITETSLNNDYERTKKFINHLHQYGCRFALDDFGSGFTSFKQLRSLPIDIIKIDGSYIRNVINDLYSQYFVEALVRISEELGLKTVAEFVENGEIAKFLIDIKIDGMQGNFFSPASKQRK